jgi:hypothetical protein
MEQFIFSRIQYNTVQPDGITPVDAIPKSANQLHLHKFYFIAFVKKHLGLLSLFASISVA